MNCLLFRIVFQRFFRLKRNSCFCVWDFLLLLACVFVQFLYWSCTESERYLQTSDFKLRTSHFEVQTSDFGIVISGFSPSLVLAFSHQTKIAAPTKADDSVSIQINSRFILIFLFNPQDITNKMRPLRHNLSLTILRYIYLGSKKSQYGTFFLFLI